MNSGRGGRRARNKNRNAMKPIQRHLINSFLTALLLFLWACAAGGGLRPRPAPPSLDRVIYEMERVRRDIRDLVVHVDVVTADPVLDREETTRLELKFKDPDKLVSRVMKPDGRLTVINGERMWVYSPDIEVVEKYDLADERKRTQVLYEMSWGLTSPIRMLVRGMNRELEVLADGSYLIILEPDQLDPDLERLEAVVDPESWLIERMRIFAPGRPPTLVKVTKWLANAGLDEEIFEFQIPEGAAVFEALE